MKDKNCVFCKIAKGVIKSEKVFESNNFFAIRDIKSVREGHTLVISKKHFVTFLDIQNKLGEEFFRFTKSIVSDLMDKKFGDGFNILRVAFQIMQHGFGCQTNN